VAGAVSLALAATLALAAPFSSTEATAASDSFDAGNIISDGQFFDANAMSQAEIQSFLSRMVGGCQNDQCLDVLRVSTTSRAANDQCSAYSGASSEPVSAILYKVQAACGVSARVLLVTLQKEQSLVTSRAPSISTLERAMGYYCPDDPTRPGWCHPDYAGLYNQVYNAARQFQRYGTGTFTWYPVGRVSAIQYHPDAECGSKNVLIANRATAALYYYTPYTPDAAALANMNGVGGDCSSYGNRNFWRFYTNWFGSTHAPAISSNDFGAGIVARDSAGALWYYQGNGVGGFRGRTQLSADMSGYRNVQGAGDIDGDGHRDLVAVDSAGKAWLVPTDGSNQIGSAVALDVEVADGTLVAPGDFTGDGIQDLFVRKVSGELMLHAGVGRGRFAPSVRVGVGWGGIDLIPIGDFDGDGNVDLLARLTSGELRLYRGSGSGGWGGYRTVGTGWRFVSIFSPGDLNGDGAKDVIGLSSNGVIYLYAGNGVGGWRSSGAIGRGWGGISLVAGPGDEAGRPYAEQPGVGDLTSDHKRDVIVRLTGGEVKIYPGNGRSGWLSPLPLAGDWSATDLFVGVGDFDGDTRSDVFTRDTSGKLWMRPAEGDGVLGDPVQVGNGWGSWADIYGVGDFDGDGAADIVALSETGGLWLYSGNGAGGWKGDPVQIGRGWGSMSAILAVGDFDGDGRSDLMARTAAGAMMLYPGDGAGGFLPVFQIGARWTAFDELFSPGDFTGDGIPDVLARTPEGRLWLYPGNGVGGWKAYGQIGRGWTGLAFY